MTDTAKTVVNLTTTFDVAGEDTDLWIAFSSGDMYLELAKELPIGTPMTVAYWLRDQWGATGDGIDLLCPPDYKTLGAFQDAYKKFKVFKALEEIKASDFYTKISAHIAKKGIPRQAIHIMMSAILAEVVVTDLVVQIKGVEPARIKRFRFGLAINFAAPLELLPTLAVRKIVLAIMYASNGDLEFPKRSENLPPPEPASIPAKGLIEFHKAPKADDEITLNSVTYKFVAASTASPTPLQIKISKAKEDTLETLIAALNESKNDKINLCKYELVDGTKISITAQAGGTEGNTFTLPADSDFLKSSGTTLAGGEGELVKAIALPPPQEPAPA
jgi:hypothetical protein